MPETNQSGPWDYKRGDFNELFEDFFRPSLLDPKCYRTGGGCNQ
jgi:hypothetical protein